MDHPTPDVPQLPHRFLDRTTRAVFFAALALMLLLIGQYVVTALLLTFAGLIFGLFLINGTKLIRRAVPVGHRAGLAIFIALLLLVLGAAVFLGGRQLVDQFNQLEDQIPKSLDAAEQRLSDIRGGERVLERIKAIKPEQVQSMFGRALGMVGTFFGAFVTGIVLLFVALYMALEPMTYRKGFIKLIPPKHRDWTGQLLDEVTDTLSRWIGGKLLDMSILLAITFTGLWLIGGPLPLLTALIMAVCSFVPNFGPFVAYIPAAALALPDGLSMVVWVGGVLLVAQTLESYIILPLVMRRAVKMPPVLLLFTQLLLGLTTGILGLALAEPLLLLAMILTKRFWVQHTLGETVE